MKRERGEKENGKSARKGQKGVRERRFCGEISVVGLGSKGRT